ncbi:octapeptide-repeat protein T2-like [Pleurodeles waltl]|uniref:octapeptide-repeat protein T2-like n=1 Tax=Pleurodeles waltl TaxID=8319 RepID=UPI003709B3B4
MRTRAGGRERGPNAGAGEAEALRARAEQAEALRARAEQAEALRARAETLRARADQTETLRARAEQAESLRARAEQAETLRALSERAGRGPESPERETEDGRSGGITKRRVLYAEHVYKEGRGRGAGERDGAGRLGTQEEAWGVRIRKRMW